MTIERPNSFLRRWAQNGERFDIPDSGADHDNGRADLETGFPKKTMISVLQGGIPPWGRDHNGILNRITEAIQWDQLGGTYIYDHDLCQQIGGYPIGAKIKSDKYDYVTFINMSNGNQLNPNDYGSPNDFWLSNSKPGNNWAILTIPSSDNSITYYTNDFKFATTVAGNKTQLYVRPSFDGVNLLPVEGTNKPYKNVQAAINDVADGGQATIYLYYPDGPYYTTQDNTPNVSDTNAFWILSNKDITLEVYGNDNLDAIEDYILQNHFPYTKYNFDGYDKLVVYMPSYNSYGYLKLSGIIGQKLTLYGLHIIVIDQYVEGGMDGAFFSPMDLEANSCIFSNIGVYLAIYGGWGGATTSVKFIQCQFNTKDGTGHFFWLSDDILSLTVLNFGNLDLPADFPYKYTVTNSQEFLGKASSYYGFGLAKTGFTSSDGKGAVYTPRGLNTYLPITVDT